MNKTYYIIKDMRFTAHADISPYVRAESTEEFYGTRENAKKFATAKEAREFIRTSVEYDKHMHSVFRIGPKRCYVIRNTFFLGSMWSEDAPAPPGRVGNWCDGKGVVKPTLYTLKEASKVLRSIHDLPCKPYIAEVKP